MSNCSVCRLPDRECICDRFPRIVLPIRFVIVRHRYERHRQSNTGALAHHVLENSALVPFGDPGVRLDVASLCEPGRDSFVLFPVEGAAELDRSTISDLSKTSLIVLDSSWRQARRMSRRIAGLRKLTFLSLPRTQPSEWQLRRASTEDALTTIDAIAAATRILGFEHAAQETRAAHELFATSIRKHWARYPNPGPSC